MLEQVPDRKSDHQHIDHGQRDPADRGLAELGEIAGERPARDRRVVGDHRDQGEDQRSGGQGSNERIDLREDDDAGVDEPDAHADQQARGDREAEGRSVRDELGDDDTRAESGIRIASAARPVIALVLRICLAVSSVGNVSGAQIVKTTMITSQT